MPAPIGHNRGPKWRPLVDQCKLMLSEANEGDTITFKAMSEALGRRITSTDYSLQAARKELLKEKGIVFDNVLGTGYRRVDEATKVAGVATKHIKKMHRNAKRGLARNRAADPSKLPREVRATQLQQDAFLVTIARTTHGRSVKARTTKLPSAVADYFQDLAKKLRSA